MSMENKYVERIHNIENGELIEVEREYTAEQLAEIQELEKLATEKQAIKLQNEARKKAVLERIGLTEEEAQLLLG